MVAQRHAFRRREVQRVDRVEQNPRREATRSEEARAPAVGSSVRTDSTQPATASTVGTAVMATRIKKIRRRKGSAIFEGQSRGSAFV